MDFLEFESDRALLAGFVGWVSVSTLWNRVLAGEGLGVPRRAGVYAVVLPEPCDAPIEVLTSAFGYNGRNPHVPEQELRDAWVEGTQLLYVGRAQATSTSNTIAGRVEDLIRFGMGEDEPHYGGKRLWHLSKRHVLRIGWKEHERPKSEEARLQSAFASRHDEALPFANERREREGD